MHRTRLIKYKCVCVYVYRRVLEALSLRET